MVVQGKKAMSFFGDGNLIRISQLPKTVILSPVAKDLPERVSFKHTILAPSPKTGLPAKEPRRQHSCCPNSGRSFGQNRASG